MNFKEFDKEELNQAKGAYAQEAKEKWGDTQEFEESQEKTAQYSKEEWDIILESACYIRKYFNVLA